MSKLPLFLETTIQIERIFGTRFRRLQLATELQRYHLITSQYVYGEYLRTVVKSAVALHHLAVNHNQLDDLLVRVGQHVNKRESSRMMLLLAMMMRSDNRHSPNAIKDQLAQFIQITAHNHFWHGIDKRIDVTMCGLALEQPARQKAIYYLRTQCVRTIRECDLAEQMTAWRPQLRVLAEGLRYEKDASLQRMGDLAAQIIDDPIKARGRNCTWYLGDMVIALSLPEDVPLYTTNRRHFEPLLSLLGKQLHSP